MSSNKKQKIGHYDSKRAVCILCETSYEEELMVGKFFHHDEFSVHHFCMLLSSGLEQKGQTDKDGIVGFLPEDIWLEVKRGKRLRCFFCKKNGATVGCCNKNCKKVFHVPCAYGRGVLHQFFDNFSSFCGDHKRKQKIPNNSHMMCSCPICLCPVNSQEVDHIILSPCCKNFFHRQCIQMQALCAGYFFRCPICNNKENFQNEMLTYGIYIPEQDAAWELEDNAYQDLCFTYARCDVSPCKCPKGRLYGRDHTLWEIMICYICGSQGCHVGCGDLSTTMMHWECPECAAVSSKVDESRASLASPKNTDVSEPDSVHEVLNLKKSSDKSIFGRKHLFVNEEVPPKKTKRKKKKNKSRHKDNHKFLLGKIDWTYGEVKQVKSFTTEAETTTETQEVEKLPFRSSVQLARNQLSQKSKKGKKRKKSHSYIEENSVLKYKKKQKEPVGCKKSDSRNIGTLQDISHILKKKTWAFNEETLTGRESSKEHLPKSLNSGYISAHFTEPSGNNHALAKCEELKMYLDSRVKYVESTTDKSNDTVEINHAKPLSTDSSKVDCAKGVETYVSQTNSTMNKDTCVTRTKKTVKENKKHRPKFVSSVENSTTIQSNSNTLLSLQNVPCEMKINPFVNIKSLNYISFSCKKNFPAHDTLNQLEFKIRDSSALDQRETCILEVFRKQNERGCSVKVGCYNILLNGSQKGKWSSNTSKKEGPLSEEKALTSIIPTNRDFKLKMPQTARKSFPRPQVSFPIKLLHQKTKTKKILAYEGFIKQIHRVSSSSVKQISTSDSSSLFPTVEMKYQEIPLVKTPKSRRKSSFEKGDKKSKSSQVDVKMVQKQGEVSVKKSSSNRKCYSKQLSILDFVIKSAPPVFLKQQNSKDEPYLSTGRVDSNYDTMQEVRSRPGEESCSKKMGCLHCPKEIPDIIKSHVSAGPSHQCY